MLTMCVAIIVTSWPTTAHAQRAYRRYVRPVRSIVFVGGYYGYPSFAPYSWWYPSPWIGYRPLPYYGYAYDNRTDVRVQVTPREAEVYVDGYLAGTVDDFDGTFQRLRLPPGEHEITIYLAGFRTVRQKVLLSPGSTYRIRHALAPLPAGEAEPRPAAPPAPPPARRGPSHEPGRYPPPDAGRTTAAHFGTLAIRVQPFDADILIDGEVWKGADAGERLTVQVGAGTRHVEIRKDGYAPYTAEVHVRAGETATVNVSLTPR
jgi:hypothetical protein